MPFRPTLYLGRWFGVEIRLDLMVVLLIGMLFALSLNDGMNAKAKSSDMVAALVHVFLLIAMLGCMLLHELGHAMAAKLRGHRPTQILLSFVGLTWFEAKKPKPGDETFIALAGPTVNLILFALFAPFVILYLGGPRDSGLFSQGSLSTFYGFLAALSLLNLFVAFGNLLPIWPTDGARALRGFFTKSLGYAKGTERAVTVSHGIWLIVAGVALLLLCVGGWLVGERPAGSTLGLVMQYQLPLMVLAGIGIYYGWVESSRVKRLSEEAAKEDVGPPEEFAPKKSADGKPRIIDAEIVSGGRKDGDKADKPAEKSDPESLKAKAEAGWTAAKALWAVSKASGKGMGWFASQGLKMAGGMFKGDDKDAKK